MVLSIIAVVSLIPTNSSATPCDDPLRNGCDNWHFACSSDFCGNQTGRRCIFYDNCD